MTFTREQAATLNTLLTDHHAQEAQVVEGEGRRLNVWAYDGDDWLIFTAQVDDLGGIKLFEWLGALA